MIFRVHKTKNYTVMSNYHLRDKNLSLKAKGLLALMLSLPEEWDYSVKGLAKICKDGETAIRAAIKELETNHYLKRERVKDDVTGKIIDWNYSVYENPADYSEKPQKIKETDDEKPLDEKPQVGKPLQGFNAQINTNKINTNKENKEVYSSEAADTAKTITEYSVHDKEEVSVKPKPKFKMSAPEQMFESEYQFGNTKPRKSNLHEKCIAYVYEWTNDDNTRKLLIQYLGLCFEMGSIRGINQWKGMLDNTLVKCQQKSEPHTYDELIQLAIDHGWKTFYEWKEYGGKTKQYKSSISDADYRSNRRVTAADKSGRAF